MCADYVDNVDEIGRCRAMTPEEMRAQALRWRNMARLFEQLDPRTHDALMEAADSVEAKADGMEDARD